MPPGAEPASGYLRCSAVVSPAHTTRRCAGLGMGWDPARFFAIGLQEVERCFPSDAFSCLQQPKKRPLTVFSTKGIKAAEMPLSLVRVVAGSG
jgi:hypothetical protein